MDVKLSIWVVVVVVLLTAPFGHAGVEELRVTADFRGMPLRGALNVLETAIPTEFAAREAWLGDPERPILDVVIEDKPLLQAITTLVAAYGFYPVNENRFITLRKGTAADADQPLREHDKWDGP